VSLASLFEHWSAAFRDRVIVTGPDAAAIVTPDWHGLLSVGPAPAETKPTRDQRIRLFAKPDDFFELADVANRCGNVAGALEALLEQAGVGDVRAAWQTPLPDAVSG
jgi:hypothetical protein